MAFLLPLRPFPVLPRSHDIDRVGRSDEMFLDRWLYIQPCDLLPYM
jgi:hypothetical protein